MNAPMIWPPLLANAVLECAFRERCAINLIQVESVLRRADDLHMERTGVSMADQKWQVDEFGRPYLRSLRAKFRTVGFLTAITSYIPDAKGERKVPGNRRTSAVWSSIRAAWGEYTRGATEG